MDIIVLYLHTECIGGFLTNAAHIPGARNIQAGGHTAVALVELALGRIFEIRIQIEIIVNDVGLRGQRAACIGAAPLGRQAVAACIGSAGGIHRRPATDLPGLIFIPWNLIRRIPSARIRHRGEAEATRTAAFGIAK